MKARTKHEINRSIAWRFKHTHRHHFPARMAHWQISEREVAIVEANVSSMFANREGVKRRGNLRFAVSTLRELRRLKGEQ